MRHLLVADSLSGDLLQGVDPGVTYSIAELLLLAPGDSLRQHIGKGLTHNLLLHRGARTHLGLRVGAHGDIEELLIEEGHTTLHTPSREALVGSQTVVHIELAELANSLIMELFCGWGFVEIEVASEDLVGTLA